ncbi:glycerophosphodiester phosphodiesterase family protein [Aspergillus clavatus NRRL 1]|uniref:glycerophosphodiester phosphodiesterase n=1 Tax=Aspergillus clavatus (strain ATCC 1007 / CBS 513.65 / DSM 816 / NCTC 3887 / NRRL 1 / QM 1276 / 107) TaxID=344612 RepID=A1CU67_ASPCL|nr:glycerophosphoryl diester phosphodiesterase family protein [Aspergillus clavatus NRRL 1]EAW06854.1 glycerophosphoryl diester phosphodiesterase family protein [Aspergillus clavatus NRRL 1]
MRIAALILAAGLAAAAPSPDKGGHQGKDPRPSVTNIQVGSRPYYLVDAMADSPLKKKLESCQEKRIKKSSKFSISHRGAALQFPEHTREGMLAAARQGAGIIECDVAFTSDRQLVCRHSQCDLHTTTNILAIPELAAKCSKPFQPAANGKSASARCCTSDITLAEFKTLCGKMDGSNPAATTPEEYQLGTPDWRTDLYATCATLMDHNEFIALVDSLGLDFTPELKTPQVAMPFQGDYTQAMYAQQLIDDYKKHGIRPSRVWAQSFLPDDILYWIEKEPAFGKQAVYLDERVDTAAGYQTAVDGMDELAKKGVKIMAPPIFALLNTTADGEIVPSEYARAAQKAGLEIITWSLERSGPLKQAAAKSEYYIETVKSTITGDGDMYRIVDALARKVGVKGIFSDWPATVTYYANCMGLN